MFPTCVFGSPHPSPRGIAAWMVGHSATLEQATGGRDGRRKYTSKVQQRPLLETTSYHQRLPVPDAKVSEHDALPVVRDEEAAGSNPATPTQVRGPFPVMRSGPSAFRAPLVRQDASTTTDLAVRVRRQGACSCVVA